MISFVLTFSGLVLLAMDRVVSKERVITFDNTLVAFCRNFGPLKAIVYQAATIVVMAIGFVWLAPFLESKVHREVAIVHPPADVVATMLFITGRPKFVVLLLWLASGVMLFLYGLVQTIVFLVKRSDTRGQHDANQKAHRKSRRPRRRQQRKHRTENPSLRHELFLNLAFLPIVTLLCFPVVGLIGIAHVSLMALIYPMKPLLLFNGRVFSSFSGVLGLIAAIIGAFLQFRRC